MPSPSFSLNEMHRGPARATSGGAATGQASGPRIQTRLAPPANLPPAASGRNRVLASPLCSPDLASASSASSARPAVSLSPSLLSQSPDNNSTSPSRAVPAPAPAVHHHAHGGGTGTGTQIRSAGFSNSRNLYTNTNTTPNTNITGSDSIGHHSSPTRSRHPSRLQRSASPHQGPSLDRDYESSHEAASSRGFTPTMSFQSMLSNTGRGESSRGPPRRPPYPAYITDDEAVDSARGQKRKGSATYATPTDRHGKMRRSADARPSASGSSSLTQSASPLLPPRPDPMQSMVTITCYHPTVAQKSYGAEKRYFSPPPFVSIRGPLQSARSQALEMNVVTGRESGGQGDTESSQAQFLDGGLIATFRTLHVGGLSNRKRCQLGLAISDASTSDVPETVEALANRPFNTPQNAFYALPNAVPSGARRWATFLSAPIAILSKPAKHMKSHDPSSITFGSTVSLYHRLNSQTARTKYVHVNPRSRSLETSGTSWTPLVVERVDTPMGPGRPGGLTLPFTAPSFEEGFGSFSPIEGEESSGAAARIAPLPPLQDIRRLEVLAPVTFNSTVTLYDPSTGVRSPPLVIKKVVNGHIKPDEPVFEDPLAHLGPGSTVTPLEPVGQLQKVAFMRPAAAHPSVAGPSRPRPQGPALEANMYWGTPPDSDEMMFGTPIQSGRPARAYRPRGKRSAAVMDPANSDVEEGLEELDDAVVWTIVSVTNFKYSYFASDPAKAQKASEASQSVTPFPALRQEPFYRPQTHSLQLLVDDFDRYLEIWIGSFGPLRVNMLRHGNTDPQGRKLFEPKTWFESRRPPADQPAAEFAIGGGSLPDRSPTSASPRSSPEASTSAARAGPSKTGPKPLRAKIPPALDVAKPQMILQVELPPMLELVHACFRNDPSNNVLADLPIIFMRTVDGTGFHSGKSVVVENILGEHCSRNDVAGWTVRVVSR